MSSNFRLGSPLATTNAIPPQNTGAVGYAQARLNNTVSRAVARHANALAVDAIGLHIYARRDAGLICTCQKPAKPISLAETTADINPNDPNQLRLPRQESGLTPQISKEGDHVFKVWHTRGPAEFLYDNNAIPPEFNTLSDNTPTPLDSNQNQDNLLGPTDLDNQSMSDEELARMLNDGGAVYGGDKTPCGICYSTGRTHGYELVDGRRIVLDASGEWQFGFAGDAVLNYDKFPAQFSVNSSAISAITWAVDLPTFTNGWLAISVRNNLEPARNVQLQWWQAGQWVPLTIAALAASDGQDRRGTQIRVVALNIALGETCEFTHVELIYSTMAPIPAQFPPINLPTNFDTKHPIVTAEFEVMAIPDELPRESVLLDTKLYRAWKVVDVTPKLTAQRQVFAFSLNARNLQPYEPHNAMQLIFDPLVTVPYRGLEANQGNLAAPFDTVVPNNFTLPETAGYSYNTEES